MCGIVGCVGNRPGLDEISSLRMRDSLVHRGPDDAGVWSSSVDNVMLGSRRLAIFDLSPRGHQPMQDPSGALTIVFNGEIYNWVELRRELQRYYQFHTRTDTEVLLAAYAQWGTHCLDHLNGMFAFAIWDAKQKRLFAARDRFGEKPFYYYHRQDVLLFASETKALLAAGVVPAEPNLGAIYRYIAFRETDASEETFFKDVISLPAGHALAYSPATDLLRTWQYWDIDPDASVRYPKESAYAEYFSNLLSDSVKLRLRSDVTVGSCLSGGLDSSTIVSHIASQRSAKQQVTFSIRSEDPALDEGRYIRLVSEKFSTTNFEVYPDPLRLVEEMDSFVWHQDHPSLNGSVYAQWCVMRLARDRGVTVLLDGQGGDEHLAGYMETTGYHLRDLAFNSQWATLVNAAISRIRHSGIRTIGPILAPQLPQMAQRAIRSIYEPLSLNDDFALSAFSPPTSVRERFRSSLHNELYRQLRCTMLPKLLRFADRSSMAFSREVRLPFLDHRIAEYLFAIPESHKISGATTKAILRQAAQGRIPSEIISRKDKKGFEVPQSAWLSGPLRPWVESILNSSDFRQRGWIDPIRAHQIWRRFLNHPQRYHNLILRWVSLETWARVFLKHQAAISPAVEFRSDKSTQPIGDAILVREL
jgi:asparagine synthase (glutamine-hydrolysing)